MAYPDKELDTDLRTLKGMVELRPEDLPAFLEDVHPADLAAWMQHAGDEERELVFGQLGAEYRAELLEFADDATTRDLVALLDDAALAAVVEELGADEAVDLLALVPEELSERVLHLVDFERAQGLRQLQSYDPDTAGGLMTTDFVTVQVGSNIGDAIKDLRKEDEHTLDEEAGVFVVDTDDRPVGWISDRDLVTTPIHTAVEDVMTEIPVTVHPSEDQEDVAIAVSRYGLQALPVVNSVGTLVGIVTADDAGEVFETEAEEDIRRLVGTSTEDQTYLPVLVRVRQRLPLQALTVVGGLVTAYLLRVALPGHTDRSDFASDLLRYIPIIIGLAGNVGIQASTILVRAFATGEVTPDREGAVLRAEVTTGFVIGVICGLATTVVAAAIETGLEDRIAFGLAVGIAVSIAVTWASALGSTIPMVCRRLGIDPAVVAGPFMITLSDISGTAIFMGTAHLVLAVVGRA